MAGRFFIVSSQSFFLEYIHGVKENERERERERERDFVLFFSRTGV
jgi:hypothetical protein